MQHADDSVVISQSLEHFRKAVVVIATMCAAFDLTIFEAKTAILDVSKDRSVRYRRHIQHRSSQSSYKQAHDLVYHESKVNHDASTFACNV